VKIKRLKRLKISAQLFFSLFSEGFHPDHAYTVVADPIPADAQLANVRLGWPNDIELVIQSETFPELKEGEEIPLMQPTLRSEP
jgi:hypothetical protein